MKLRYRCAVVSYCPDMRSATARSLPVAILLVGRASGGTGVAVAAARHLRGLDPLSAAFMKNLVEMIKGHVNDAISRGEPGGLDMDTVLHSFEESLRNSLHVSEISEEESRTVELSQPSSSPELEQIVRAVMREAVDAAIAALMEASKEPDRAARQPTPNTRETSEQAARMALEFPDTTSWPLPWLTANDSQRLSRPSAP
jgi:hypothetical protein